MLRTTLLCTLLAAILVSSATAQKTDSPLEISKAKPVPIVLAKDASASEKTAANELQAYLRKITDASKSLNSSHCLINYGKQQHSLEVTKQLELGPR